MGKRPDFFYSPVSIRSFLSLILIADNSDIIISGSVVQVPFVMRFLPEQTEFF